MSELSVNEMIQARDDLIASYNKIKLDESFRFSIEHECESAEEFKHNPLNRCRVEIGVLDEKIKRCLCRDVEEISSVALQRTNSMRARDVEPLIPDWPERLVRLEIGGLTTIGFDPRSPRADLAKIQLSLLRDMYDSLTNDIDSMIVQRVKLEDLIAINVEDFVLKSLMMKLDCQVLTSRGVRDVLSTRIAELTYT